MEIGNAGESSFGGWSQSLQAVKDGLVDAVYVKGAAAQDGARKLGLTVGIDLDKLPEKRFRVNNGTPRPIKVRVLASAMGDHGYVLRSPELEPLIAAAKRIQALHAAE